MYWCSGSTCIVVDGMISWKKFLQCKIKAASTRKPQARSASCEGEARAHLLPRPGRTRLPRLLGLRAAAQIARVVCDCLDS